MIFYESISPDENNDKILNGKFGDGNLGWSSLEIKINKCDKYKNSCFNETLSNSILDNSIFTISFLSSNIDHYNTTHPYTPKVHSSFFILTPSILKSNQINLKQVTG